VTAELTHLKAKRDEALAERTANQAADSALETARNQRENLYKPLGNAARSLVDYVKSSGKPQNDADADSLLKGCIPAKAYIKSKHEGGGAYKNIAKTTRFTVSPA
ncbi:MAG: hypothetical protein ABWZ66_02005, partial [Pyrinomonadaceae bacterium]